MSYFEARYSGVCTATGDRIKVGDPIVDFDDGYAHPDCVTAAERAEHALAHQSPCTSCFMIHAGECL